MLVFSTKIETGLIFYFIFQYIIYSMPPGVFRSFSKKTLPEYIAKKFFPKKLSSVPEAWVRLCVRPFFYYGGSKPPPYIKLL